jgi:hypothetical protein
MRFPTRTIGDGELVQKRIISTVPCKLAAVCGYNNGGDLYIQIHELGAEPGAVTPKFSFMAGEALPYSFALPCVVDMDACTIVASSTLEDYTASAGTPVTIQAILAA